jgi:outer membrane immunogenic protein
MRIRLFAALGVTALAAMQSANAADMGPPPMVTKAPPPVVVPLYNWTGFYIGANGGGGWGHDSLSGTQATVFGPTAFTGSSNSSGGLAGGQIGVNYQFPTRIVIGIEADGDWANIKASGSGCSTFTGGVFTGFTAGCASNSVTLNDFGTVRGRVGYAWNNVLLYGTGGWAWGNSSGTSGVTCLGGFCPGATIPFTGGGATFSNFLSGWTAGGGIEVGFLPNWTVRVEYLHLEFDGINTTYSSTATTALGTSTTTTSVSSNHGIEVVRAGVNYLFNFGGPGGVMHF